MEINDKIYKEAIFEVSKPPIGCSPAWLAADSRIITLSQAINRQLNVDSYESNYKLIKLWAEEIITQAMITEHYKEGIK